MRTRSEAPSTPLSPISCDVLDNHVLEYLAEEGLIEDDASIHERPRTTRMAAHAAFQQLHEGDVRNAMAIMQEFFSSVLQDQRLEFKLKRQQFIELLRQGTSAGDAAALACARDELAPLALDAYPEAYLDFKKSLLMLLQPQSQMQQRCDTQQQQGPQQQQQCDWSVEARHKFAEVLYHTILQQIGWSGTQLEQQLSYLLHIFNLYTTGSHAVSSSSRGSSSHAAQIQQLLSCPEASLVDGLMLEGRDEAAVPPDVSGQGYMERDVQALMSAVSITRSAAVDALKGSGGDAAAALKHQLARFRLNKQQLDIMAWEYAVARGLVEPSDSPITEAAAAAAEVGLADMDVDIEPTTAAAAAVAGSSKASKRNTAAAATDGPVSSTPPAAATAAAVGSAQRVEADSSPFQAAAAAAPSINVSCSARSAAGSMLRSASQSPPYKVPRWRCKQTPSRFKAQPPPTAATAAGGGSSGVDHQQVVVCGDDSSRSSEQSAVADCKRSSSGKLQQQQQQQQRACCADAAYLVDQAGKQQQQQRWQQLQQHLKSQAAAAADSSVDQQQSLQKLQGLVKHGRYQEVEELLEDLQPGLLQEYPVILFDIKRLQFTKLIQDNLVPAALQLARSQLTPLADKHPELLPSLKASMALLLPAHSNSSSTDADTDDSANFLATLLPLLQSKLGIEPPKIVKLLRLLLTCHKGWFRLQRCQDPFAAALGLDKLSQAGSSSSSAAAGDGSIRAAAGRGGNPGSRQQQQQQQFGPSGSTAAAAVRSSARPGSAVAALAAELAAAARQALMDDPLDLNGTAAAAAAGGAAAAMDVHDQDEDDDDAGPMFAESAVLQVMEVLELPRAAALELLAEHGGDAQAAIMQVFG